MDIVSDYYDDEEHGKDDLVLALEDLGFSPDDYDIDEIFNTLFQYDFVAEYYERVRNHNLIEIIRRNSLYES